MNSWKECLHKAENNYPKSTDIIPELGIIPLPQFTFMQAEDAECEAFLHEHFSLTLDKNKVGDVCFASQCNEKGKLTADLTFFYLDGILTYCIYNNTLERHAKLLAEKHATQLLTIHPLKHLCLFALFGTASVAYMQKYFNDDKKVVAYGSGCIIAMDNNRYLFALPEDEAINEINNIGYNKIYPPHFWSLLDIQAGIAHVEPELCAKYSPKSFNQKNIQDAPFHHAFYMVTGIFSEALEPGTLVERECNDEWLGHGEITSSFRFCDNVTLALAIMPNDSEVEDNHFKIHNTRVQVLDLYEDGA